MADDVVCTLLVSHPHSLEPIDRSLELSGLSVEDLMGQRRVWRGGFQTGADEGSRKVAAELKPT